MFLNEIADFVGGVVTQFGKIILLGDFNIHICCPSKTLSRYFGKLLDSVPGPTHNHGHTLDLVFTLGFSISDIEICDTGFSDQKSVLFTPTFPGRPAVIVPQTRWTQHVTASAADEFASAYPVPVRSVVCACASAARAHHFSQHNMSHVSQ